MRGLLWLLVFAATLAGCVVETDLARRDAADAADGSAALPCESDGGTCAGDSAWSDAREEASPAMDGMAGMGGSMPCDGHDCDAAVPDTDGELPDGMGKP